MKILAMKRDFECDHSTRSYGYIGGVKLDCDYGVWNAEFRTRYRTELYRQLQKFKAGGLSIEKKFNQIVIELELYSESIGDDEYEWSDLVNQIREELEEHNFEPLEVLRVYYTSEKKFTALKPKTKLGKKLRASLTPRN